MSYVPQNRLAQFFPVEPPELPPLDKLLASCYGIKLELIRYEVEGEINNAISYEIHGQLTDDDGDLLAAIVSQFRSQKGGGK